MAAAMFNNSNSLPVALMQSLVVTVPGLKWGPDDTNDAMLGRALGYLVLYSTMGMMVGKILHSSLQDARWLEINFFSYDGLMGCIC